MEPNNMLVVVKILYLMSFTRKKHKGHVTPKAKSDKADRVTKEETYRPRDAQKQKNNWIKKWSETGSLDTTTVKF